MACVCRIGRIASCCKRASKKGFQCHIDSSGNPMSDHCVSIVHETLFDVQTVNSTSPCLVTITHDVWPRASPLNGSEVCISSASFAY